MTLAASGAARCEFLIFTTGGIRRFSSAAMRVCGCRAVSAGGKLPQPGYAGREFVQLLSTTQGTATPTINNYDGTPIPCTGPTNCSVPVSPVAANVIKYLMPVPNSGSADSFQNNYSTNFPAPISSNQFDVRIDQNITSKQSIYGRYTFKNRSVTTAPTVNCAGFCDTSLSPLLGGIDQPEQDRGLTVAYNYTISSKLINEFRGGFNSLRDQLNANVNSSTLLNQVGITGIPDMATVPTVPD
jgi:hypothetical protein